MFPRRRLRARAQLLERSVRNSRLRLRTFLNSWPSTSRREHQQGSRGHRKTSAVDRVDFNVENYLRLCGQRGMSFIFEISMVNATTWDMADEMCTFGGQTHRQCPDPTGAARKTAGVGLTDHAIFRKAGLKVSTPRSPWKIRDKVNCINTAVLDGEGTRRLKINPKCRELIKSLRTLVYDDNGLPNKKLGVDHMFDALGYMCLMRFNLAKHGKLGQTTYRVW